MANIQHDFELILGDANLGLARRVDVALGAGTQQVPPVQSWLQQVGIQEPHAEILVHQTGRIIPSIPPVSGKQRKQSHSETRTCENQERIRTQVDVELVEIRRNNLQRNPEQIRTQVELVEIQSRE